MKLVWSHLALSDRDGIFRYIEAENPRAAIHVDEQIADGARRLLDFPESGRPGRVAGTRELVIPRTPYVAAYHGFSTRSPSLERDTQALSLPLGS